MAHAVGRSAAWAFAGAVMSAWVGAPAWNILSESDAWGYELSWLIGGLGALTGVIVLWAGPSAFVDRGATIFAIGYPAVYGWGTGFSGDGSGFVAMALWLAVCALVLTVWQHVPRALRLGATVLLACMAWALTVLTMVIQLFGLVFLPLAIAWTLIAKAQVTDLRPQVLGPIT